MVMRARVDLSAVLASFFGVGFFPIAPGTVATGGAMLLYLLFAPSVTVLAGVIAGLVPLGILVSDRAEVMARKSDPSWVVIDEVVGYGVSVLFLPVSLKTAALAFFLFRFFDIIKPPPIRNLERLLKGGVGIMADDILAGIFTNILVRVVYFLAG